MNAEETQADRQARAERADNIACLVCFAGVFVFGLAAAEIISLGLAVLLGMLLLGASWMVPESKSPKDNS